MSRSPTPERPAAVLLVRNGVSHDARVLRAARTMELTGLAPLIVGAATADTGAGAASVGGVHVVRVSAALPRPGGGAAHGRTVPAGAPAAPASAAASDAPVFATGASPPRGLRRLARVLGGALWQLRAVRAGRHVRPTLVHANDLNTMWAGLLLARTTGARLVYDAHELWPDRNGRWEHRWVLLTQEWLLVRLADAVITASPGYAAEMARRYRIPTPPVVRNIPAATGAQRPHTPLAPGAGPTAVYVGGLLPGRGLELAIAAIAQVPGGRLRLVGPGSPAVTAALHAAAARLGIAERVEIPGSVAPDALVAAIADADVGLSLIEPICRSYELTLPNKLFEYAAAGLPVVASDLPVQGPFVREHDLGIVVALEPAAVAAGILAAARRTASPGGIRTPTWEDDRLVLLTAYGRLEVLQETELAADRDH